MADYAYYVTPDNNRMIVYAENLSEKDKTKRFICAGVCEYGKDKGKTCETELGLVLCTNKKNYFSTVGVSEHRKGCSLCKTVKEIRILSLNQACQNKTDADLLRSLLSKISEGGGIEGKKPTKPKKGENKPEDDTDEDVDLVVTKGSRPPKNADEIYDILKSFDLEDVFANKPVSEWIVDERTFSPYYKNGLKDGQIAMVTLGKTKPSNIPDNIKAFSSDYLAFVCVGKDWNKPIFFLVPKSKALFEDVIKIPEIKQFCVIAKWYPVKGVK